MKKEQDKYSLIIQYGLVKGMVRVTKEVKRLLLMDIKSLEKGLESAKRELLSCVIVEDCGYFYREEKARAEGELLEGKRKQLYLNNLGLKIQRETCILKKMKRDYRERYGEDELLLVTHQLERMGKERAKSLSGSLRQKKEKEKNLSHIAQVLVGQRLKKHLYERKEKDHHAILKSFDKSCMALLLDKNNLRSQLKLKKEMNIYAALADKFEDKIMTVALEFIQLLNELDDEDDSKLVNFKNIIVEHTKKLSV